MAAPSKSTAPFQIGQRGTMAEAAPHRPSLNLGAPWDVATGTFMLSQDGHYYCTGGLPQVQCIAGRGNTGKSILQDSHILTVLDHFKAYIDSQELDCEFSKSYPRMNVLAASMPYLHTHDLATYPHFMLTSLGEQSGNAWFKGVTDRINEKIEAGRKSKALTFTTPFPDSRTGKEMTQLFPSVYGIDALSTFTTDVTDQIYKDSEIGDGKAQTVHMRGGGAKSQMIQQIPPLAARSNSHFVFTAHLGDGIAMDPYAPPQKKLSGLKQGTKMKYIPENVTFSANALWMVESKGTMHDSNKKPLYPYDAQDKTEGDKDLQKVAVTNLRGKYGPSERPIEIIYSMSRGVDIPATLYNFLKNAGRFGITGDNVKGALDLYPELIFTREDVRPYGRENPAWLKALALTVELLQVRQLQVNFKQHYISPKALYKALTERGYDMAKILDTRSYWVFREMEADEKPYLSIIDILIMAAGTEEHPWYALYKK